MEIPRISEKLKNQAEGKKLRSQEGQVTSVKVVQTVSLERLPKDEVRTTESINVVDSDTNMENVNENMELKHGESVSLNPKVGPAPEVTSGISTTTSCSKGDIEEEIEAIYSWVPEIANHFIIIQKIGEGTFSSVYQAKLKNYPEIDEFFALKHIIPTSHPSRIENELRCLLRIGGKDNVMGVKLCFRNRDHVIIVMPYFPHDKFQDYLQELPLQEAREYIRNLLLALKRVHQFNVIHRDVKPSNFLYNRQRKEYALVDFGLATGPMLSDPTKDNSKEKKNSCPTTSQTTACKAGPSKLGPRTPLSPSKQVTGHANEDNIQKANSCANKKMEMTSKPVAEQKKFFARNFSSACSQLEGLCDCFGKPMICELCAGRNNQVAPRAGTAGFRAPEVLMKSPEQDTAVDIWSSGVIFLSLLSGRYPFFRAQDDMGYLAQIVSVFGSKISIQAATAFGKLLTLSESIPPVDIEAACLKLRESQMAANSYESDDIVTSWDKLNSDAFDLLYKLLDPNPRTRISADAALHHPFFTLDLNASDT